MRPFSRPLLPELQQLLEVRGADGVEGLTRWAAAVMSKPGLKSLTGFSKAT